MVTAEGQVAVPIRAPQGGLDSTLVTDRLRWAENKYPVARGIQVGSPLTDWKQPMPDQMSKICCS